ncbi:MAG: lysylphosphatidylglycerol synthase transmembrane domain-containing protein [Lysobacter sp.]
MNWREQLPWVRRVLIACFLLVAAYLLWRYARMVDWREVMAAIAGYPASRLGLAAAAAALAYACYCGFDVLARAYTGHALRLRRVLAIAFVCYAFNLNLGAVVGGIGFRYRLYSHAGLRLSTISRVVAFTIASNWSGFLLLGGLSLVFEPVALPAQWSVATWVLPVVGSVMLAALATWLALCAFSPRRSWSPRGHRIELPSLAIALSQLVLASASWLAIAAILYLLMPGAVGFATVAGTLLLSVLANLVIRVPANLGVMEAVFVALLGAQLGTAQVLAAVLTWRALFHIGPLLLAVLAYLFLEAHAVRRPAGGPRDAEPGAGVG